ncbi:integral membrane protein, partial [Listeria innocua FSL S4-378]
DKLQARFFNDILYTFHTKCQCNQEKMDLFCPKSSGLAHLH